MYLLWNTDLCTSFFLNVVEISNIFDRIGSINNKTNTVSTMKAIGKIYLSMYIDRRISLSNATIFYFARKSGVKSWEHQFSSNHLWFNAFSLFACRAIRVYRFRKFYILIYSFFFLSFKFLKNLIEVDVYVYYIMLENLKKENFPFMKFEKTNFFLISIPHFNSLSFLSIVTAWTSIFLGLNQQDELTKNTLTLTNKIQRMDNYHSRSNGFSSRVRTLSGEKKRL